VTTGVRAAIGESLTGATIRATIRAAVSSTVVAACVGATVSRTLTRTAIGATICTAVTATGHTRRTAVRWSVTALVVTCFVQGGFGHR
jgi:hypothetical protein